MFMHFQREEQTREIISRHQHYSLIIGKLLSVIDVLYLLVYREHRECVLR